MDVPKNVRFHRSHQWVRIDDGLAYIGISHVLRKRLGTVLFFSLPPVGIRVMNEEEIIGTIDALKSAYDLISPLTGTINQVNSLLIQEPNRVHDDPYREWLYVIETSDTKERELEKLMSASEYERYWQKAFKDERNIAGCM